MKLEVNPEKCNGCGDCIPACPVKAIVMENGKARILPEKCIDWSIDWSISFFVEGLLLLCEKTVYIGSCGNVRV